MNKKRLISVLLILIVLAAAAFFLTRKDDQPLVGNLIRNGDFSAVTNGMPDEWETGMWVTSPGASFLEASEVDGKNAVLVENAAANDARFEQTISVRPNSILKLTALARAEGCEGELGANVSFLGVYGTSQDLTDTDGQWQRLTLYAQTAGDMHEVTVCLRLGGYGAESTGKAWFTDVTLEEVQEAPVGAAFVNLATPRPAQDEADDAEGADLSDMAIPLLLLGAAAYLALGMYLVLRRPSGLRGGRVLLVLLGAAFLLRIVPACLISGYEVDMSCFTAWAAKMAANGPAGFYTEGYFCDYPPFYMLVLGILGCACNLFGIPYSGMGIQVMLKLVPIVCDLAMAVLCWRMLRGKSEKTALLCAALLALNPAYIITGSCWGQIDAVTALFLLLILGRAEAGEWHFAIPLFALAVLTKPQAGLLAPLGAAALVKDLFVSRKNGEFASAGKRTLLGLAGGIAVTLLIALPFSANQASPLWLVDRYTSTLSSYNYATLSTGNLMFLLGGNWAETSKTALFGLTYAQLGTALMVLGFAAGIALYLCGRDRGALWISAALTLQLIFVLGVKMHERYIIPALVLLLIAAARSEDIRLYAAFLLTSAASAVNVGVVLAFDYLIAPNLWLGYILSVLQLLAAVLTAWAAVDLVVLCHPAKCPALPEKAGEQESETGAENRLEAVRREILGTGPESKAERIATRGGILAITLLTLVYAAVAFYDLGATKAPQTGYVSSAEGEQIVLDLGERREAFHIYYYGGISDTQFTFETSDDGENWSDPIVAFFDRGECFKWEALCRPVLDEDGVATGTSGSMLYFDGRYLRVVFTGAGSALWEVAAVDDAGTALPITVKSSSGALEGRADAPEKLVDEQDTVPVKPTYYNSMYFDEIYHARTGYEHAHALSTYETTHPPLGKDLMALCITIFGMTPFAWRLAGTVAGILMLPAIWLLGLQLLKNQKWAFAAAFLFACDCMHFTQTRIATIDSFPVLFMMIMFLFMARWRERSLFGSGASFRKGILDLFLSGLFMGLAIASKWIGCYGAAGLALLFFAHFLHEVFLWRDAVKSGDPTLRTAASLFPRRAVITLACCCVFFVVIPVVVYCLSYIPYLSYYGPVKWNARTFQRIWDAQVLMYDYHKNLVATHYFASPWYEWPVIAKPMWFYSGAYSALGKVSSILTFGNPAVWWTGLGAILYALYAWVRSCALPVLGIGRSGEKRDTQALTVLAVGFLSAYLPWVLVSRLTFIYHYFASVPFIILATVFGMEQISRSHPKAAKRAMIVLGVIALVLFIGFYPLASGHEVPRSWCDAMNWFKNWMWY